jgi:hypothetical protein
MTYTVIQRVALVAAMAQLYAVRVAKVGILSRRIQQGILQGIMVLQAVLAAVAVAEDHQILVAAQHITRAAAVVDIRAVALVELAFILVAVVVVPTTVELINRIPMASKQVTDK